MSHRILVIDHNPQGLERVVGPLRGAGYEVAIARTAADGASSFGHFEPDLVFIAARLPRTHGTVLCRELKRTSAGSQTPIVLIVEGTGVEIDLPPLDQFGADRLLQKPVSAEELQTVCSELLRTDGEQAGGEGEAAGGDGVDYPDDGLSTALEELDALEFDLPESFLRGLPGATASANTVPIADEHAQDISNHIDDLFGGGTPAANPPSEPSTGQDLDADAAVLDEFDLDSELNTRLGQQAEPSPPRRRAADRRVTKSPASTQPGQRPSPPPPSPSATIAAQRPAPQSAPVVGRFQTEALTRRPQIQQETPKPKDSTPVPPRWIWGAIPITVAVVALAVFFMSRPASPPPLPPVVAAPAESHEHTVGPTGTTPFLSLLTIPFDSIEDSSEPADPDPEPVPVVEAEPVVRRPPVIAAVRPEAAPVVEKTTPPPPESEPEPEPEPLATLSPEFPPAEEISVDFTPEQTPEIIQPEEPQEDIVPEPEFRPEPEPVTRAAILLNRVEARVAPRDLKNGGGTVILRVRVGKTGAVSRVIVKQGLPAAPTLEGAAVAAVLRWRYEPALEAGEPVESWETAEFPFGD